jgi:hypothetical protein
MNLFNDVSLMTNAGREAEETIPPGPQLSRGRKRRRGSRERENNKGNQGSPTLI